MPANYHNQVSLILSEKLQGKITGPHCSQLAIELYYMGWLFHDLQQRDHDVPGNVIVP